MERGGHGVAHWTRHVLTNAARDLVAPLCLRRSPWRGPWKATWRSGDVADCKSAYPGSIPGVASKQINNVTNKSISR